MLPTSHAYQMTTVSAAKKTTFRSCHERSSVISREPEHLYYTRIIFIIKANYTFKGFPFWVKEIQGRLSSTFEGLPLLQCLIPEKKKLPRKRAPLINFLGR